MHGQLNENRTPKNIQLFETSIETRTYKDTMNRV